MPRYPAVEKTVHGQPVTQTVFLNTICDALLNMGSGGKVGDLISTLGPEWDTLANRKRLSQTLVNMAARGVLKRSEEGVYEVNANRYKRKGVTRFDEDEKVILDIIRRHGGFCQWADIAEGMDIRPHGSAEDRNDIMATPEYARVLAVIRRSDRIRQDVVDTKLGRGVYNLPWDEINGLPLMGKYASIWLHYSYLEFRRQANQRLPAEERQPIPHDAWYDDQELFFTRVGDAFMRLRELNGLTREEVAATPAVRAALMQFQNEAPDPVNVIRARWRDKVEIGIAAIRAEGEVDDGRPLSERRSEAARKVEAFREAEEWKRDTKMGYWLYQDFEEGVVGAHCHAPLSLYTTVADLYGACPVALSRGIWAVKPFDERLRPGVTRRTMDERIEHELAAEAAEEQTQRLLDTPV